MLRICIALFHLLALSPVTAGAQAIDYARSRVTVLSRQMGVPVEAPFRKFTAQVNFDPAKPQAGSARVEIDLASFDIGDQEINDSVKDPNWFDTRRHPAALFVSSSVRALGEGRYEARGPLSIKGKSLEVIAPFTVKSTGADRIFEGVFPIRRLQYNIGDMHWRDTSVVADEVKVRFRLYQAAGKQAPGK